MKRLAIVLLITLSMSVLGQTKAASGPAKYGSNSAAGHYFTHDGVRLYYETYGTGEPLLLVHGNGGSISDFRKQIPYFAKHYRVIAMDSRDQGKSADTTGPINYELMTDDLAALLDHLHTGPVDALGWSDGGIEVLLLAVRHPEKVKRAAAMAANLNPTESALYPETLALVKDFMAKVPAEERETAAGKRELKVVGMMLKEPNIDPKLLESIKAPVLVMAADHDLIRDDHTLEIYHRLPNSQLAIFPNATHMVPYDNPLSFNATVETFFRTPFVEKDRIKDMMASYEKLLAGQ